MLKSENSFVVVVASFPFHQSPGGHWHWLHWQSRLQANKKRWLLNIFQNRFFLTIKVCLCCFVWSLRRKVVHDCMQLYGSIRLGSASLTIIMSLLTAWWIALTLLWLNWEEVEQKKCMHIKITDGMYQVYISLCNCIVYSCPKPLHYNNL